MSTGRKPLPRGLYKRCACTDPVRCSHEWYGAFKLHGHPRARVSLPTWTGDDIRTLGAAISALDDLKAAIRAGTFDPRGRSVTAPRTGGLTLTELVDQYFTRYAAEKWRGLKRIPVLDTRRRRYDTQMKPLLAAFGTVPITGITTPAIEDWQIALGQPRTMPGTSAPRIPSQATQNRAIADLRRILNWAVRRDLLAHSPFRKGGLAAVRLGAEDNTRDRRVSDSEEERLLAHAPASLRALIILAVDAGVRMSEMLEIRVGDVDLDRGEITLRGVTTKSARTRIVPIATLRLRTVVEWLRLNRASGLVRAAHLPLIANDVGERVSGFRTAWETAVLRTYGPAGTEAAPFRTSTGNLTLQYRQAFKAINLHWHDLRHEYASRLAERGVPVTEIQRLLGHASPLTTARYISSVLDRLKKSTQVLETGRTFDPCAPMVSPDVAGGASTVRTSTRVVDPSGEVIH